MTARPRRTRLSHSGDFDAVYRTGRSVANRHLVVYAFRREADAGTAAAEHTRLGLAVSRKVGGAVERNRVKRVLREQFHALGSAVPEGLDLVVIARPGVAEYIEERGSAALGERLAELVVRLGSTVPGDARP